MSTPIIAPAKPKNARSKRAAVAREPKLVEKEAKTAVFVRSAGISDKVKTALTELVSHTEVFLKVQADEYWR
jgi:ribosome production factor 2